MSSEEHTDFSCLNRALWWAKKNGYVLPPLEQAMFDSSDSEPLRASLRLWACGLIMSHDFAKAVFGDDPMDKHGYDLLFLRLWAKQTHYKVLDKLYAADRNRPSTWFIKPEEVDLFKQAEDIANVLIPTERIEMRLKDIYATIPVETHQPQEPTVENGIPAWQHHLKEMAIAENPFHYLDKYINEQTNKSV